MVHPRVRAKEAQLQNNETQAPDKPGNYIEGKTEALKALCAAHEGDSGALELVLRLATLGDEIGRLIEKRAKTLSTATSEVEIPNNGLRVRFGLERDLLKAEDRIYAHWKINGFSHSTGHLHRMCDHLPVSALEKRDSFLNEVADEMTRDIRKSLRGALDALFREVEFADELAHKKARYGNYFTSRDHSPDARN